MADVFRDGIVALIPKMRSYATALMGSASEADDLVQDVLIRAWRFRASFREGSYLQAWIFKIMRNEFLNQRLARRPVLQQMQGNFEDLRVTEGDQEWRVRYRELMSGLSRLPEHNREALLLVVGAGLTCEEAAEVLGCAAGTVKSRVSRAREYLHKTVDLELETPYPIARPVSRVQVA